MMWTWIVYTIRDDKWNVVYVGMTTYPAVTRFVNHRNSKKPLGEWIRNRIAKNKDVIVMTEMKWHAKPGTARSRQADREAANLEKVLIKKYAKLSRVFFNTQHVASNHPNVKFVEHRDAQRVDEELEFESEGPVENLTTGAVQEVEEAIETRTA